jgi:hypothetical protein
MSVIAPWLDAKRSDGTAVLLVEGYIWVGQHMRAIGPIAARAMTVRGWEVPQSIDVTLTDDQLIGLEATRRDHEDVELVIDLQTTLLGVPTGVHPTATSQTRLGIRWQRWLEVLDGVGAAVGIVIRVPSPLTDAATREGAAQENEPSLVRATTRLREARSALRENDFERCIRTCRAVLENVKLLCPPVSAAVVDKTPARQRTQDQRWAALFHDLYSIASAASHDDDLTATFRWNRSDAETILAAASGLLKRAAGA